MKTIKLCLLLFAALFATGCPKSKPTVPDVLAKRVAQYELNRFDQDLSAYDAASIEQKRGIRDRMIFRLKRNIDTNYHEFENQLFTGRAQANVLADITELGATAAINITNGERAKNIISMLLAGFKGGRKSFDENFFRERTTAVIISQMQASRARIETVLITNIRELDAADYSLDEALGDLINYFYAGTLQKGLQDLAQQTGEKAVEEKGKVERLKLREVTAEDVAVAVSIRERFNAWFKDAVTPPIDLIKQAAAVKAARAALQELSGQPVDPNISNNDLFTQLDDAIERIAVDEAGIRRVRRALGLSN